MRMLHFVLVEPGVPENVGAAARALKTMGFSSLWIVNSQAHRDKPARILAHGSHDILDSVREFSDLAAVPSPARSAAATSATARSTTAKAWQPDVGGPGIRA
jgi:tRNA/rRNA methyltransferase